MMNSLEWKTVTEIQVGDKLAQIVAARHGEKLANVERRSSGRRAIVTATSTNYKGDVTLTMTIGRARITRQWLSNAVLATEVISTCETNLVNMPNLASVVPAPQTNTNPEVTMNTNTPSNSGGWTLSDNHRSEIPGARAEAGRELARRYANGRPTVMGVLINNHRAEYNEILTSIVRASVDNNNTIPEG